MAAKDRASSALHGLTFRTSLRLNHLGHACSGPIRIADFVLLVEHDRFEPKGDLGQTCSISREGRETGPSLQARANHVGMLKPDLYQKLHCFFLVTGLLTFTHWVAFLMID